MSLSLEDDETEIKEINDDTDNNNEHPNENDEYPITDTIASPINKGFTLELGDLIEIIAPTNPHLNEQTFYILYIDERTIELVNVSTYQYEKLSLDKTATITDESITEIYLLDRCDVAGYARQHHLTPNTWIDIYFAGEQPAVVTGIISDLEEDRIELTTYPDNEVIYIDFEYKGIPKHIPIEKIIIRDEPSGAKKIRKIESEEGIVSEMGEDEPSIEWTEEGESIIKIPDGTTGDENIRSVLHNIYLDANELFGEDLAVVFREMEITEKEKKYTIEAQMNDMTDEYLANIPNNKRTTAVMQNIHRLVERFRELREIYSEFDENGIIKGKKKYGDLYKPLVDKIFNLDKKISWIVPVATITKKLHNDKSKKKGKGRKKMGEELQTEENRPEENEHEIMEAVLEDTTDTNRVTDDDTKILEVSQELKEMETTEQNYYKNIAIGDESRLNHYMRRMFDRMTPYESPLQHSSILEYEKEIKTDIEAIINNYNGNATVMDKNGTNSLKYFIQRYNLGIDTVKSQAYSNGVKVYIKDKLNPNEKISIKSLIVLPETAVRYSHTTLPATNILTKTELSHWGMYLYRIFNKKLDLEQHNIMDVSKEIDYEELENINNNDMFLSKIKEYVLDETLHEERDKYEKMLNVIVPRIRTLIRLMRKYIKDKISMVDIIKNMEPFMIYSDNITYGQFKEIRYFIKEKMIELRKKISEMGQEYSKILTTNYNSYLKSNKYKQETIENPIESMFFEKRDIYKTALAYYAQNKSNFYSSSEELQKILQSDGAVLYSNLMTFMLLSLVTPKKILNMEEDKLPDDDEHVFKDKDCSRKYLAKKYSSIEALQKDNGEDVVYYDKEYDDTPYHILSKYENEKKKMLKDKFEDYLSEVLVQKHGYPRDQSKEAAKTLIEGKKKVSNGEYAIITLKPNILDPNLRKRASENKLTEKEKQELEIEERVKTKFIYYKRINHVWVRDDDIGEENFYDTNDLFCNASVKCNKNVENGACESVEHATQRIKETQLKQAMSEFDKRFQISMEELKSYIEKHIYENERFIEKNNRIKENSLYKYNYVWYKLGESKKSNEEVVISKHIDLLNLILGQTDFAVKQDNILKFVTHYCREFLPEQKEDMNWYYCIDTSTKIIPRSIVELANAFVNGTYLEKLDVLCHELGVLSDNGDSIVDKHSGYVLKKLDLVAQDTYDEVTGFKITTNAVLEKDFSHMVEEKMRDKNDKNKYKIYEDETSQMVYNVMHTICNNMGVPLANIDDFIMTTSLKLINDENVVLPEKKYERMEKLREKENKPPLPPYSLYRPQAIIMIVASSIIIAIQTAIPHINTSKTFPRCVRSFTGYPMDGIEDMGTVKYMACVIKGSESSIPPWNAIKGVAGKKEKVSASTIEKRIKDILDKYILTNSDVINKINKKKEYLILNPYKEIMKEHSIQKWVHFLPPVVEYTISNKGLGLAPDFNENMLVSLRSGNKKNNEVYMYSTNVMRNTYYMVELINDIVKKKGLALKMGSVYPLHNACCNEINKKKHPLYYFIDEDNNIEVSIKRAYHSGIMLNRVYNVTEAPLFYNNEMTRTSPPVLPSGIISDNIYKSYIHYCNFDNDQPISDDLLLVCPEKPDHYNKTASLDEKIDFLKRNQNYDVNSLHSLMTKVNHRNRIPQYRDKQILKIETLKDILDSLHLKDSVIIEEPLRRLLSNVLEHYDETKMHPTTVNEMDPFQEALYSLRNYLSISNSEMYKKIMKFMRSYGNVENSEMTKIEDFFENIHKWEMDETIQSQSHSQLQVMHNIVNFIKNAIYYMTRCIPNAILNKRLHMSFPENRWLWDLSSPYVASIDQFIREYSACFQNYIGDTVVEKFLANVDSWSRDIIMFMENLPVYSPIHKNGETYFSLFDKRTTYMLYTYLFYSTYYEYIQSCDDSELLNLEIRTKRNAHRIRIAENEEVNLQMDADYRNIDESTTELVEDAYSIGDNLEEVQIIAGEQNTLKSRVSGLMLDYIRIEMKNKNMIDRSYDTVIKKMTIVKKHEKKAITDVFENLDKDERNIEFLFKKHKLEKWNVNALGLYDNQKEAIMANRIEQDLDMAFDAAIHNVNQEDVDIQESYDVADLERMEDAENADLYDREATDISHFTEGYMDGMYYEEDMEDDFADD